MKERMQKTLSQVNGCPQRNRSETEWYGGVQTFMWMCEDNIVEVHVVYEFFFFKIMSLLSPHKTAI
jgi:RNA-directed DNA polymerase